MLQKNHSTFSPGGENYFNQLSKGTLLNVSSESRFSVVWFKLFFFFLNNSLVSLIPDDNEAHLIQAVTVQ